MLERLARMLKCNLSELDGIIMLKKTDFFVGLFLDELDVKFFFFFFFTSNSFWRENLVKNKLIIEEMHDEL